MPRLCLIDPIERMPISLRRYTRHEIAQACGVDDYTLYLWFRDIIDDALLKRGVKVKGRKRFTPDEARIICDYLGVPLPE